jgi:DNA replication and repair protein RecF
MDLELAQLDKVYLNDLSNYNRILNHRNKLLKDLNNRKDLIDTLDIWDIQLVNYGNSVMERRKVFINQMNDIIGKIHEKLTGGREIIKLLYEPGVKEYNFEDLLKKNRERDIRMKSTTIGPHRDDICFMCGDMDIRKFGSQGQQRTTALSLKLAEIELVKKEINDTPILLLDDVLSELDKHRQNYLLDSIRDIQTLITCTGVEDFINKRFYVNKILKVEKGHVTTEMKPQTALIKG